MTHGVMRAMLEAIKSRGPDDEGIWQDEGAWLGHRRLSIVDLSAAGHQPMISSDGRFVLSLNGEIYNYRELRAAIDRDGPFPWKGHSDTEVLVETVARFGISETLLRTRGMFAFALWDRRDRIAYLARDRFGEKPLYYFGDAEGLTFASEVRALRRAPGAPHGLSSQALALFFRYGYIPAPHAIYEGVRKLPPGHQLVWRAGRAPVVQPFWTLKQVVEAGREATVTDESFAVERLDELLRDAIGEQMVADVPLGAFLSGGIDSSLVTAIMQQLSDRPVKTFTLGFDSPEFNEAEHALAVARHLGAEHTEHYVTEADARAIVPSLGAIFDEPFADASQIPTYLISRLARREVKVCLTGDGGDEMFAGYVRYPGVPRLWNAIRPWPLRGPLAAVLSAAPLKATETFLGFLGPVARRYTSRGRLGPSIRRAASWLAAPSQEALYEMTMMAWSDGARLLLDPPSEIEAWRPPAPAFQDDLDSMLWRDAVDYLPGDILCKVDRAAMAHSLETRVPLLDSRIADFAWSLPRSMKIRDGDTKWLMRQVLYRYVPSELIDRPKLGFSPPLHAWVTGPLRSWAESLIDPALIRRQQILRPELVATVWNAYLAGDSSADHKIWSLLMFQAWLATQEGQS
jgi:asparagine synthase (glutamine-hydrolysing)